MTFFYLACPAWLSSWLAPTRLSICILLSLQHFWLPLDFWTFSPYLAQLHLYSVPSCHLVVALLGCLLFPAIMSYGPSYIAYLGSCLVWYSRSQPLSLYDRSLYWLFVAIFLMHWWIILDSLDALGRCFAIRCATNKLRSDRRTNFRATSAELHAWSIQRKASSILESLQFIAVYGRYSLAIYSR